MKNIQSQSIHIFKNQTNATAESKANTKKVQVPNSTNTENESFPYQAHHQRKSEKFHVPIFANIPQPHILQQNHQITDNKLWDDQQNCKQAKTFLRIKSQPMDKAETNSKE